MIGGRNALGSEVCVGTGGGRGFGTCRRTGATGSTECGLLKLTKAEKPVFVMKYGQVQQ
jgi:hypothetical protein